MINHTLTAHIGTQKTCEKSQEPAKISDIYTKIKMSHKATMMKKAIGDPLKNNNNKKSILKKSAAGIAPNKN